VPDQVRPVDPELVEQRQDAAGQVLEAVRAADRRSAVRPPVQPHHPQAGDVALPVDETAGQVSDGAGHAPAGRLFSRIGERAQDD